MLVAKRAAVVLWLVALLVPGAALADPYTVRGIAVDVRADDAVQARERAIEEAQVTGLRQLLQRLTLPQYHDRLPGVDAAAAGRLVTAYEVERESMAATQYVGELAVTYDRVAVQNLVQGTGVPIVVDLPPSLLIVPALDDGGRLLVFDGAAGWRDAWAVEAERNTLLGITLPLADLGDLRSLGATALAAEPATALAAAAARYGTEAALLVVARPDDAQSPTRVTTAVAASHGWPTAVSGDSMAMDAEATVVWQAAVRRLMGALENEWKNDNLVDFDSLAKLPVSVALGSLEEWAAIRAGLAATAAIRRVDVQTFSQAEAELIFSHIGNVAQLQRALEARGLTLSQGVDRWRLQRTAGRGAG